MLDVQCCVIFPYLCIVRQFGLCQTGHADTASAILVHCAANVAQQYVPLFLTKEDLDVAVGGAYRQRNAAQISAVKDSAVQYEQEYKQALQEVSMTCAFLGCGGLIKAPPSAQARTHWFINNKLQQILNVQVSGQQLPGMLHITSSRQGDSP